MSSNAWRSNANRRPTAAAAAAAAAAGNANANGNTRGPHRAGAFGHNGQRHQGQNWQRSGNAHLLPAALALVKRIESTLIDERFATKHLVDLTDFVAEFKSMCTKDFRAAIAGGKDNCGEAALRALLFEAKVSAKNCSMYWYNTAATRAQRAAVSEMACHVLSLDTNKRINANSVRPFRNNLVYDTLLLAAAKMEGNLSRGSLPLTLALLRHGANPLLPSRSKWPEYVAHFAARAGCVTVLIEIWKWLPKTSSADAALPASAGVATAASAPSTSTATASSTSASTSASPLPAITSTADIENPAQRPPFHANTPSYELRESVVLAAARADDPEVLKWALENKLDFGVMNAYGDTIAHIAAYRSDGEVLALLHEWSQEGRIPNMLFKALNCSDRTLAHEAARGKNIAGLQWLWDNCRDVIDFSATDSLGDTFMHAAIRCESRCETAHKEKHTAISVMEWAHKLNDASISISQPNAHGSTLAHAAAYCGYFAMVKRLRELDPDFDFAALTNDGDSLADEARSGKRWHVLKKMAEEDIGDTSRHNVDELETRAKVDETYENELKQWRENPSCRVFSAANEADDTNDNDNGEKKNRPPLRVVTTADTHGKYWYIDPRLAVGEQPATEPREGEPPIGRVNLPHGDVFVVAGDLFIYANDLSDEEFIAMVRDFNNWLGFVKHHRPEFKAIIVIGGNHDARLEQLIDDYGREWVETELLSNGTYMHDELLEIGGRTFYASPVSWGVSKNCGFQGGEYEGKSLGDIVRATTKMRRLVKTVESERYELVDVETLPEAFVQDRFVDVLITHSSFGWAKVIDYLASGCPSTLQNTAEIARWRQRSKKMEDDGDDVPVEGPESSSSNLLRCRLHIGGHDHMLYGARRLTIASAAAANAELSPPREAVVVSYSDPVRTLPNDVPLEEPITKHEENDEDVVPVKKSFSTLCVAGCLVDYGNTPENEPVVIDV